MRSAMPDPIPSIRQALGIDTWGQDLYRLKRRIGEILQRLEAVESKVAALEPQHNRPRVPSHMELRDAEPRQRDPQGLPTPE
jgi:hypothetical protein